MKKTIRGLALLLLGLASLTACGKSPSTAKAPSGGNREAQTAMPAAADRQAAQAPPSDVSASSKPASGSKGPLSLSFGKDGQSVLQSVIIRQD